MGRTIHLSGFPSDVTVKEVKEFLEGYTGNGTVSAIKIRPEKNQNQDMWTSVFVIVEFTTADSAELVISLVNDRLRYKGSVLRVWDAKQDIITAELRPSILTLKPIAMYSGCQVSLDQFSVLFGRKDVQVNFGYEMQKINFFLYYQGADYRLELFNEDIWKIQLRCPNGQNEHKFLLIQVIAAPRIYKKPVFSRNLSDPTLNYFKDGVHYQWDRTTDFTRWFWIGQSSAICLELPYSSALPDFKKYFFDYEEDEGQFIMKDEVSYSKNLSLVPIVGPPNAPEFRRFPFEILFKVCSLVQHGYLAGPTLDANFFKLVHPSLVPVNYNYIQHALEAMFLLKDCCYEPVAWLKEQYERYDKSNHVSGSPAISLDEDLVCIRRVQITPSRVYFWGPDLNLSNHVLRNYSNHIDNFIRVSFVDENFEKLRSTDLSPRNFSTGEGRRTGIYNRILSTLRNGIVIGEKRFEFLAFSTSQIRVSSTWMFAKADDGLTAEKIRESMGDFSQIKNVAKYSARLGQSFSSSKDTHKIYMHEVEIIPDIELVREEKKYVFSDGIGKISADFARKVAVKCKIKDSTPSAFQIRYGGYKGVVAVDPTSEKKLSLRKSMCKYESHNTKLGVITWSKYQPCFLNRQIITLLSTLGVEDHIFQEKQRQAIEELDAVLTNPLRAQEVLDTTYPGESSNALREMLICGYKPSTEPFLAMMLQAIRAERLQELRTKTRILIPHGRSLIGCLDETGTLEYGQVFVQASPIGNKQFHDNSNSISNFFSKFGRKESVQKKFIVKGKLIVAKNPCLHPGDVRILCAIDVPALHHMVDCIVFPQKGPRPHTDECSGSDLDGDVYFASWDPTLIPPRQVPPMEYFAAPPATQDHGVTIEQVREYFANYILNESLGIIANAHKVFADREPEKAESKNCIELARLHSIAVDFPKTGVPAEIPPHLHIKEYPDFMEKFDRPSYESPGLIGKLYREIKDISSDMSFVQFTPDIARVSYDTDLEVDGFQNYIDDAYRYKCKYDTELVNLMGYYRIKTEADLLSGSITGIAKPITKKWDDDAVKNAVSHLKKGARRWFNEGFGEGSSPEAKAAKASAWYHVTYHPNYWGRYSERMNTDHFLSFPWCIYDELIKIKKAKQHQKKVESFTIAPIPIYRSFRVCLIWSTRFMILLVLFYVSVGTSYMAV